MMKISTQQKLRALPTIDTQIVNMYKKTLRCHQACTSKRFFI